MSTKNLARTVIEGGRASYNQHDRWHSNRVHRAREREIVRGMRYATDLDAIGTPSRKHVYKGFDDKLGPARRWLAKQVGRPWSKVYGELLARFDTRTTAGRHIVFCHMARWVELPPLCFYRPQFRVDRHGILRAVPRQRFSPWRGREPLPMSERELDAWRNGRRVGARGDVLFWFDVTPSGRYRQHDRLADGDAALWRSLPAWFREDYGARI